ncbi:LapA family protein [Methylotuvimicrobium buryatense]|uniref:LapA family protein n=1 Tax=Methylotuvimicrobium buryatense TaxID=95641 RepID=A0A4P9UJ58_METBY|nr:LapA family protein [Methylotuvimicrobium buryatense]QCW81189.1 LapA family protein [Methylotuvimicrobium buryatense]
MRYVYIGLIVLVSLTVLLFKIQNLEVVTVSLLSVSVTMPVSLMVIVIYFLGMVTGGSLLSLLRVLIQGAKSENEEKDKEGDKDGEKADQKAGED